MRLQRRRLSCRPWQLRVIIDVGRAPWPRPRIEKKRAPMRARRTCRKPRAPPRTHACGVARISFSNFKRHADTGGYPAASHICDKAAFEGHFHTLFDLPLAPVPAQRTRPKIARITWARHRTSHQMDLNKKETYKGHPCIFLSSVYAFKKKKGKPVLT